MKFVLLLCAVVLTAWVLALLGVPSLREGFASYGVPLTWAGVVQTASTYADQALAWLDARPLIALIALPATALVALVWR